MAISKPAFPSSSWAGLPGCLLMGQTRCAADQYFLFRPGYMHRLFSLPPFVGSGFYALAMYEVGKMYNNNSPGVTKLPMDGAIGMHCKYSRRPALLWRRVGADGHATWFYSLGHFF